MGKADKDAMQKIYKAQQEVVKAGYECLVRGACLKCSRGTASCKVELPMDHGRYIGGQPQITAQDYKMTNISEFGW